MCINVATVNLNLKMFAFLLKMSFYISTQFGEHLHSCLVMQFIYSANHFTAAVQCTISWRYRSSTLDTVHIKHLEWGGCDLSNSDCDMVVGLSISETDVLWLSCTVSRVYTEWYEKRWTSWAAVLQLEMLRSKEINQTCPSWQEVYFNSNNYSFQP